MRIVYFLIKMTLLTVIVVIVGISCSSSSISTREPRIPYDYSIYECESIFSIGYPPDWKVDSGYAKKVTEMEQLMVDDPNQKWEYVELEELVQIFEAGKPAKRGEEPYPKVVVFVTSTGPGYSDLKDILELESDWGDIYIAGHKHLSREKTTIGEIKAYIEHWQEPGWKYITSDLIKGDFYWSIACGAKTADYDEWKATLESVVRSFRPLHE